MYYQIKKNHLIILSELKLINLLSYLLKYNNNFKKFISKNKKKLLIYEM